MTEHRQRPRLPEWAVLEHLQARLEAVQAEQDELVRRNAQLAAARESVERERERYRQLFELAPDAYLVTDCAGTVLEANVAATVLLGGPIEGLVGKPLESFVPDADRRSFRRRLLASVEARGAQEWELTLDGRRRTVETKVSVAPMVGQSGDVEGFRWIIRDVTVTKQAERQLRTLNVELERRVVERTAELEHERGRLQAVVDQLPAGLVIVDAVSTAGLFVNAVAEDLVGPNGDGGPFERRLRLFRANGDLYPAAERPLARALRRGETTAAEEALVERPDGSRTLVQVGAGPLRDSEGRIEGAILTLLDLSERERLEQSEREFVTNAAHELRTPLAAVTSAVEVLQAGAKESSEDRDLFLGHIERGTARLGRLVRALLVLARAQSGLEATRVERVELAALLEQVASGFAHEHDLTIECASDLAAWCDRSLLEQAITGLAENAVKHGDAGTAVLAAGQRADGVKIEVRDAGPGIPHEQHERMFDRFYRGVGPSSEGFGLGLAIVRQAAEAMGAELSVESAPGEGTTIGLLLPQAGFQ
jgi:PAS domain S-box-containing protein